MCRQRLVAFVLLVLLLPGNAAAGPDMRAAVSTAQGAYGRPSGAPALIVQDVCSPKPSGLRRNSGPRLLLSILFPWSAVFGFGPPAIAGDAWGEYEDTVEGLGRLMVDICAAKREQNEAALEKLLSALILPHHEEWLVATFGGTIGKRIAATYAQERDHVPALFSSAFSAFIEEGRLTQVGIQAFDEPFVQVVGYYGTPSVNLWKQRPVRLYEVRFVNIVYEMPKGRRQFIFAHVDGSFRYLGTLEPAPAAPAETLAADTAPITEGLVGGLPGGVVGGVPGGVPGGVIGGVIGGVPDQSEPPLPPRKAPPMRIRASASVMQGKLIRKVDPVYPPIARQARIGGVVILELTIAKDGSVQNVRTLRGHPLLQYAAVEAVRQWKYQPTMLGGEPVEVVTTVTINFTSEAKPPE